MSKYTIVEKTPKGNTRYKDSIISYQVDGCGYDIFKARMIYIITESDSFYAYIEGETYPHIDTTDDRKAFIEEIKAFQKGGSYRKAHPILKSTSKMLEDRKRDLQEEIYNLDVQIREAHDEERKEKFKTYTNNIDYKSLNKYIMDIQIALNNDRYYVKPVMHIFDGYKLEIIDKQLNKPVYIGEFVGDEIRFRDIKDYEIPME